MHHDRNYIIISDNFPPCKGGGIAEWAYGVATILSRTGSKVTVLSRWKNQSDIQIHRNQPFNVQAMQGRDWNRYRYWYALYYLWKQLQNNTKSVVIATTWELGEPMNLLKLLYPESCYLVIAHGLEITKLYRKNQVRKFRKTIENAILTVAVSRFTRDEILGKISGTTAPVIFLPNGVDPSRFHPVDTCLELKKRLAIAPETRIILTLARVIERKGHDTVLKALPGIIREFPDTIYIIAGPWHPPYYEKLQSMISEYGLERHVLFTSFVDDRDLNSYYSMSDVYVMVSRTIEEAGDSEGFGITFLEANACLCPVIGSRAGGIGDAVEDTVNGFLVNPDDPDALKERILCLFRDDRLRQRLAYQGKKRVDEHFTWEKITETLLVSLEKQLSKKTG